jgi:hypothetical protein
MLTFNKHHVPIAVLLQGNFSSLYANRISAADKDSIVKHTGNPFQSKGSAMSKQIVIADADVLTNKVDKTRGPLPMGMIPFEDYQFANRSFFINAVEYLNEPAGLLESRNKTIVLRLLDKGKVDDNRLLWQLALLLGPLGILLLLFVVWSKYRKVQFAD